MSKKWDTGKTAHAKDFWAQALRVAKPGAHLLAFCGGKTYHRLVCAIEDAGWETREVLCWLQGQGFPKSQNIGKQLDKMYGAKREVVGIKPGHEGFAGRQGHTSITSFKQTGGGGFHRPWMEDPKARERYHQQTAPATPDAIKWDGWGTALKPSFEPIVWATKPLTAVPFNVILETTNWIGLLICLSLSSAKSVESLLELNPRELGEESVFVQLVAALSHTKNFGDSFEKTAMFKSPGTEKIILNIAELWKHILDVNYIHGNMFTTSTVTGLITSLRILNSLVSQITRKSIPESVMQKFGLLFSASTAEKASSVEDVPYKNITTAQELASLMEKLNGASIAVKSFMGVAQSVNTVLQDVTTILEKNITGLRPGLELICLARKPLSEKTIAANVLKHGTGGINIDACRVGNDRITINTFDDGAKPFGNGAGHAYTSKQSQGRWPANLLLSHTDGCRLVGAMQIKNKSGAVTGNAPGKHTDKIYGKSEKQPFQKHADKKDMEKVEKWVCSEDCPVKLLDEQSGEIKSPKTYKRNVKSVNVNAYGKNMGEPAGTESVNYGDKGGASRFFPTFQPDLDGQTRFKYQAKASKKERNLGMPDGMINNHTTVKPLELMKWLTRLITPPNGIILDPFAGSGTTGMAAFLQGFRFIGIEQDAEYYEIMKHRLRWAWENRPK